MFHQHQLLLLEGPEKLRFHQLPRLRGISRHTCVLNRLLDKTLLGIPRARSSVQGGQLFLATVGLQALQQQPLEQAVKAIPPLALIEGDQKEVRALQPVQGGLHLFL